MEILHSFIVTVVPMLIGMPIIVALAIYQPKRKKNGCVYAKLGLLVLPILSLVFSSGLIVLGIVYNHYFDEFLFWVLIVFFIVGGLFFGLYFVVWQMKFYDDTIEVRSMFGRKKIYSVKERTQLKRNNKAVVPQILLKFGKRRIEINGFHVNFYEFESWLSKLEKHGFNPIVEDEQLIKHNSDKKSKTKNKKKNKSKNNTITKSNKF